MSRIRTVGIVNHFTRRGEGIVLAQQVRRAAGPDVAVNIAFDDGSRGLYANWRAALESGGEGWTLVMHDDMAFGRAFFRKADHILRSAPPRSFLSFYNPRGKSHDVAQAAGYRLLRTKVNFWAQALVFPEGFKEVYLRWVEENIAADYPFEDRRLVSFLERTDWYCYTVLPSLMQHLGAARSTLEIGESVFGVRRSANNYAPYADVEHVDWASEFATPFEDRRTLKSDPVQREILLLKDRYREANDAANA